VKRIPPKPAWSANDFRSPPFKSPAQRSLVLSVLAAMAVASLLLAVAVTRTGARSISSSCLARCLARALLGRAGDVAIARESEFSQALSRWRIVAQFVSRQTL